MPFGKQVKKWQVFGLSTDMTWLFTVGGATNRGKVRTLTVARCKKSLCKNTGIAYLINIYY